MVIAEDLVLLPARRPPPVVLLPLVEHDLECAHADHQEGEPDGVEAQPLLEARLSAATRSGGSTITRAASSDSSAPTGTFSKNTQRHEKLSVIQPPSVGPMAGANTTEMP